MHGKIQVYSMQTIDDETIDHIFVHCPFSKKVWFETLTLTHGKGIWDRGNIFECFKGWYKNKSIPNHKALSCTAVWPI